MISGNEIRNLYEKYGNKKFPVEEYCIGCNNCQEYSFPCLNCADYVFDGKIGYGNPDDMPDIETPLDMFKYIHYNEEEIRNMIPKENKCPDAPIKKNIRKVRSSSTGAIRKLEF